jgi:hypothetical protein
MLAGAPPNALEDFPMAAMDAIEVAERQNGLNPMRGARIVREVDDVHEVGYRPRYPATTKETVDTESGT